MLGRKASFWVAVGCVAVLSNFALELAARKLPFEGLKKFNNFTHCGPGGQS